MTPQIPLNSVYIDPRSLAVLGESGDFRATSEGSTPPPTVPPTSSPAPPHFQIFDLSFLRILGPTPTLRLIAQSSDGRAFAHEAPVWIPVTDEVFFASKTGNLERNNEVSKIKLGDAKEGGLVEPIAIQLPGSVQMTNGGTNFRGEILFVNSGRGLRPPNVVHVNPNPPYQTTVVLDNFFGRPFNSLNDVKVHPKSGAVFFTDPPYGFLNGFRPEPQLPHQVYRFEPDTGTLRVVADGFDKCNGIAFNADGSIVTDTGMHGVSAGRNQTRPATIYAFGVDETSQSFTNRRVFAYVDAGFPDGINVDMEGNVYAGCGDGVQVWNLEGTLLGKVFLGKMCANFVFAGPGQLVVLAETEIYLANIAASGVDLTRY